MFLPFYEFMVDTDNKKDWEHRRYGVNILAHLHFLNLLVFQIEGGIYQSNINTNTFDHKIVESGVGYNWRIGVGMDL